MKRIQQTALTTLSIGLIAGTATSQVLLYDQGTIGEQRPVLTSYSNLPSGWLSTQADYRAWSWKLNAAISDHTNDSPNMHVWIHTMVPTDLVDANGAINGTELLNMASEIANEIVSRNLQDSQYAIFFQNWTHNTRLARAIPDQLDTPLDTNGVAFPWTIPNILNNATPWRETGLSYTFDDYLTQGLIFYIEHYVMNHPNPVHTVFPKPARMFLDEEFAPGFGCTIEPMAAMYSTVHDDRFTTEPLSGVFDYWDLTPSTSYMNELFSAYDFTDIQAFVPQTTYDDYTAHSPLQWQTGTDDTCLDYAAFPITNKLNGVLRSTRDGLLEASFGDAIEATWGPKVLWSNYSTSAWYTDTYPLISDGNRGARLEQNRDWDQNGYLQTAGFGSSDMHAPVLYAPYQSHMWDTCPDIDDSCTSAPESHEQAWLRTSRTKLDHAIFSFDEIDSFTGIESPKRFSPWITSVGTQFILPGGNGVSPEELYMTSKANVRDIVALCKSRGVNEVIFWGNNGTGGGGYQDGWQTDWDSTNDILSQVYDYTLSSVLTSSASSTGALEAMTFGEEHAFDVTPLPIGLSYATFIHAEFDTTNINTLGDSYTLITEVIDGGGPWSGANAFFSIFNYNTGLFEFVSMAPTELFSTSTQRAEFTDSDADDFADGFTRVFDNQASMPGGSVVADRKTINRWDFTLPMGFASLSDYRSPVDGKMKVEIISSHSTAPGQGLNADPQRYDMIQLYETEKNNDNFPYAAPLLGDLTGDGIVDLADFRKFTQSSEINDINNDGIENAEDLRALVLEMLDK